MTIYLALPVVVLVVYFLISHMNVMKNKSKVFLIVVGALFVVLMAFRDYTVGSDTKTYFDIFYWYNELNYVYVADEPGFLLMNKLVYCAVKEFWGVNLVVAIITIYCVFRFIYKYSDNVLYSVIIFILNYNYYFTFNVMRQGVAAAIILLSYEFMREKKFVKSFLFLFLAVSFHYTALIYLPLFLIYICHKNISLLEGWFVSICIAVSFVLGIRLVTYIIPKYSYYLTTSINYDINLLFVLFWIFVLIFPIVMSKGRVGQTEDKDYIISSSMIVLYITINIITFFISMSLMNRLEYMLNLFILIFVPNIERRLKNKKNIIFYNSVIIIVLTIYYVHKLINNVGGIVPYSFLQF